MGYNKSKPFFDYLTAFVFCFFFLFVWSFQAIQKRIIFVVIIQHMQPNTGKHILIMEILLSFFSLLHTSMLTKLV